MQKEPDQEQKKHVPVPPDAPVESPEADPRTEGAPDSEVRSVSDRPDGTEEQMQEAFE